MICLLAFIVFAILGIFSVKYRVLAKEAFNCTFRKITFRPCATDLNIRIKTTIVGTLLTKAPRTAKIIHNYFTIISIIFTILVLLSTFYTAQGLYYYAQYGNCNGPQSTAFCILHPFGTELPP
ncbi:MAG: hypothetical protein Q7R56_01100 [Nanoarchaeota archaeon]|nr:hypothetical protein [Nanoarchaeota archaeon]